MVAVMNVPTALVTVIKFMSTASTLSLYSFQFMRWDNNNDEFHYHTSLDNLARIVPPLLILD